MGIAKNQQAWFLSPQALLSTRGSSDILTRDTILGSRNLASLILKPWPLKRNPEQERSACVSPSFEHPVDAKEDKIKYTEKILIRNMVHWIPFWRELKYEELVDLLKSPNLILIFLSWKPPTHFQEVPPSMPAAIFCRLKTRRSMAMVIPYKFLSFKDPEISAALKITEPYDNLDWKAN